MPVPPSRSRSPAYYVPLPNNADIPPIPPIPAIHRRMIAEPAQFPRKPAKSSVSSGSTNRRTDSDVPSSSDGPSPPTPKDSALIDVVASPTGTQVFVGTDAAAVRAEVTTGHLYYDGSEEFYERGDYTIPEPDTVASGFARDIKTIVEEQGPVETSWKSAIEVSQEHIEHPEPDSEEAAELPASPVPRRITRDLVLAGLGHGQDSTTEEQDTSALASKGKNSSEPVVEKREEKASTPAKEEMVTDSSQADGSYNNRHSILSQSLLDSSTVGLAVQFTDPVATITNHGTPTVTTEDGMTDLLDGYQHSETKEDAEPVNKEQSAEDVTDKKGNHTPKSSNQQSFKSCTDLPEVPCKESDAKSFKTCQDTVTPQRATSMPASGLPSLALMKSESSSQRPATEMPLPSPPTVLRKKLPKPASDSSFSRAGARVRANSKLSSREGSTVASISSSIHTPVHKVPQVPTRDSSSSKEAQRTTAVADFLLRMKFSKTGSTLGKKPEGDEDFIQPGTPNQFAKQDSFEKNQNASSVILPSNFTEEVMNTPERTFSRRETLRSRQIQADVPHRANATLKHRTPTQFRDARSASFVHQHSLSTPSTAIQEPSSVYSPETISSSSRSRVQSSPAELLKPGEHSHCDGQTTTHLNWPGHKSLGSHSGNVSEPYFCQSNNFDETTTDLRYSAYRQPVHYLPDLKEESHEDSSLNTSASNLKNSHFKFPYGGQPGVRVSTDNGTMFGRNPSTRSVRRTSRAHIRGLPSLNFSRINLLEGLDRGEVFAGMEDSTEYRGTPGRNGLTRSASDGGMRERYKSVFAGLAADDLGNTRRASMAMDLFKYKQAIEDVSIPSVNGLTERISNILPTLRDVHEIGNNSEPVEEEMAMPAALGELQKVCAPLPKRSSARLRPIPGSEKMVVVDDAVYNKLTSRGRKSAEDSASSRGHRLVNTGSVEGSLSREYLPPELEAVSPAVLPARSLSLGQQDLRPSVESRLSSRSVRSVEHTSAATATTDTHPWFKDSNYAWTAFSPDISLPPPAVTRGSPSPGQSRLRNSELASSDAGSAISTTDYPHRTRSYKQPRQLSVIEEVPRPSKPMSSNPDACALPKVPYQLPGIDQPHPVGDRYPSSSLTPPSNVNIVDIMYGGGAFSDSDDEITTRSRKFSILRPRFSSNRASVTPHSEAGGIREPPVSRISTRDPKDVSAAQQSEVDKTVKSTRRETYKGKSGMPWSTYNKLRISKGLRNFLDKIGLTCVLDEFSRGFSRLKSKKTNSSKRAGDNKLNETSAVHSDKDIQTQLDATAYYEGTKNLNINRGRHYALIGATGGSARQTHDN